jgi:hypothetical protein
MICVVLTSTINRSVMFIAKRSHDHIAGLNHLHFLVAYCLRSVDTRRKVHGGSGFGSKSSLGVAIVSILAMVDKFIKVEKSSLDQRFYKSSLGRILENAQGKISRSTIFTQLYTFNNNGGYRPFT